jgi:hypothetical protein
VKARTETGGGLWRQVGGSMAMDLPQIYRSVPCKHESSINFAT